MLFRSRILGTITDLEGNALVVPVLDDDTLTVDALIPTVSEITTTTTGNVASESSVTYTVTFNKALNTSTVDVSDFANAGTASMVVTSVISTSTSVYSVVVTPTSSGTLILRLPVGALISDVAGNEFVPPVDDDQTITVTPITNLKSGDVVVLGYNTAGSPDSLVIMPLVDLIGGTRFIVSDNEIGADGGKS